MTENTFEAIAERTLVAVEDTAVRITIRLAQPSVSAARGDYECLYLLTTPDGEIKRFAAGVDAFQALQLAFGMIGAEIEHLERSHGWTLTFNDGDAGFPRP
jgi:hypothetical protein